MHYTYNVSNVRIYDSYTCVDPHCMLAYLTQIRDQASKAGFSYKRCNCSWLHEWRAHNWMYKHKIKIDRTKDVDLNEDESIIKRIGYYLISTILSRIFI